MSLTKLFLDRNLVSDIRAGDGNTANLFLQFIFVFTLGNKCCMIVHVLYQNKDDVASVFGNFSVELVTKVVFPRSLVNFRPLLISGFQLTFLHTWHFHAKEF